MFANVFDLRGSGIRPAGNRYRRVTGQECLEGEHQKRDDQHQRNERQQPPHNEAQHNRALVLRRVARADPVPHELIVQVTSPVRWIASVRRMAADGVDTFVEIGPGSVLTGLIKRIAPDARLVNVTDLASAQALMQS